VSGPGHRYLAAAPPQPCLGPASLAHLRRVAVIHSLHVLQGADPSLIRPLASFPPRSIQKCVRDYGSPEDLVITIRLVRLEWDRQTEGFVNKRKLMKRQMYGQARVTLLRQRVLRSA
jgi:hypothetical protein